MSIKAKFIWSFMTIVVLIAGMTIFTVNGVGKTSDGFSSYREMARDSLLAGQVQSEMLMIRMSVMGFLENQNKKSIENFDSYYKKTHKIIEKAKKEIQKPSRAPKVKQIDKNLAEYKDNFYKVVDLFAKIKAIHDDNLVKNVGQIVNLLTSVMKTASSDGDKSSSLDAARDIRILLLARLYVVKYLDSSSESDIKRVNEEFSKLSKHLQETKKGLSNKKRREQISQTIKLVELYKKGVSEIAELTRKRNGIINSKLKVIGPNIAKLADDIKLSIKKDQDSIGPMVADMNESIKATSITVGIVITLFILVLSIILVGKALIQPLSLLENLTKDLSEGEGDLTKRLEVKGKDEIAIVSSYINLFIEKVQQTINSVKESSHENASISHELSSTSLSVGKNVENSVSVVNEASEQAKDVQAEITTSVKDAQESKQDIIKANENLQSARDDIISLTSKVQETAQVEVEMSHSMETLSKDADEVKTVLTIISDIADQTNLLALNAAIEAARAGEHGRGFAVVADEVRKLAERTQKTLSEINATINVVVQSIGDASTQMINNSDEIQELANVAQNVEDKINSTVELVNEAVHASDKTVADFEKTGNNVDSIVSQVSQINEISSNNARNVEEIASAAEHLNSMTDSLHTKLETFRT